MEKNIVFVDLKCDACDGEDCEACDGTGIVGSVEVRDVPEVHPDGVSKALDGYRLMFGFGFKELGERLGVSVARASELCRGAGSERALCETRKICALISPETRADIVETFAHIGDGDVWKGEMLVKNIASRLYHARSSHAWPEEADGKFQALGVIHAEYRELEQAVEHGEGREREKDEALDVIATAARFWMGEHERND